MHARIGRDDDGVVEIGRAQSLVLGMIEREIDQSIVDKIDWLSLGQQPAMLVAKLPGIGDHRLDAVLQEEALGQEKLRIEVLFRGPIIDDRDPLRHAGPMLELPLVLEHAQDRQLEIVGLGSAQSDLDLGAAGPLSLGQQRIQEGAARIGIDLDQLGSRRGKMEVVAHEDAKRPEIMPRNLGSPRQGRVLIARQSGRGLDGSHDPKHLAGFGSEMNTGALENRCGRVLMKVAQKSGSPTSRSSAWHSASRSSVMQKHSWFRRSETDRAPGVTEGADGATIRSSSHHPFYASAISCPPPMRSAPGRFSMNAKGQHGRAEPDQPDQKDGAASIPVGHASPCEQKERATVCRGWSASQLSGKLAPHRHPCRAVARSDKGVAALCRNPSTP